MRPESMHPENLLVSYREATGYTECSSQELILPELLALLRPYNPIWLPYDDHCKALREGLTKIGRTISFASPLTGFADGIGTALYLGTPTIINGQQLFRPLDTLSWSKAEERERVRAAVATAVERGVRRIVTGLGSGDITVEERLKDMGGGRIAAYKHFGFFEDWVLVRDVEK